MKVLLFLFAQSILIHSALAATPETYSKKVAWKLYNRLTTVPPVQTGTTYQMMLQKISAQPNITGIEQAAALAIEDKAFYNIMLPNWIKPWSNREMTNRIPMNDYVATVIGAIRDSNLPGKPFTRILYDDFIYVGPTTGNADNNFSRSNNNHYVTLEKNGLNYKDALVEKKQSDVIQTEPNATSEQTNVVVSGMNGAAGVITTRQFSEAYFSAGTNRRATRFLFMTYLCKDFEDLHDITIPDYRVRQDIDRKAGGDSRTYKNKCVGCHAGQDGLGGAFAYYDHVNNALKFTPGTVASKILRNINYLEGFKTTNDGWINLWASGQNASLGWNGPTQGNGPASLGQLLSETRAFSVCMVKKVFKQVCQRPTTETDNNFVNSLADEFEYNGDYNIKKLFIKSAAKCVSDEYAQ